VISSSQDFQESERTILVAKYTICRNTDEYSTNRPVIRSENPKLTLLPSRDIPSRDHRGNLNVPFDENVLSSKTRAHTCAYLAICTI